jgi:hypothetical protein
VTDHASWGIRRPIGKPSAHPRGALPVDQLDHVPVVTPAGLMLPFRRAHAVTLSIGNLAVLVFGHTCDPIWQPELRYDGPLGVALKRIAPSAQDVLDWPKEFAPNDAEFSELINQLEWWQ